MLLWGAWTWIAAIIVTAALNQAAQRGIRLGRVGESGHYLGSTPGAIKERSSISRKHHHRHKVVPLNPTSSGYVPVGDSGAEIMHVYYEAKDVKGPLDEVPVVLWLQGGPGCSSLFGMLYINGPYWINDDLTLRDNPGSWNSQYGMLFFEQPIGTGFSKPGQQPIPTNELQVAADLYAALNQFYLRRPSFAKRPLIVTGESYAGKYVPSICHYILQAKAQNMGFLNKVEHPRQLGNVSAPLFILGGMAIGNGWTDADTQQQVQGTVAWSFGLIDSVQKRTVDELNFKVQEQVLSKNWRAARVLSDQVNAFISNVSGTLCLEDVRRNLGYDGLVSVDAYLNQDHVKERLGADPNMTWTSCSAEVDARMGPDVMKTVRPLVVDILDFFPVLLYHGQFDAECGVASNDAWLSAMKWRGHADFAAAQRTQWIVNGRVMGLGKNFSSLTQLTVRNTGHMVPHDNPYYGQLLLERWVTEAVQGKPYLRVFSETEEQMYLDVRGRDEGQWAGPPDDAEEDEETGQTA